MKDLFFLLSALLIPSAALADEKTITVRVPNERWVVQFDAPELETSVPSNGGIYHGMREKLQVTVFFDPPKCPGGDSDENIYNCFTQALRASPVVEWDTERGNTTPNGIHVTYMTHTEIDGIVGHAVNVNVLFARSGKWVDFHVSVASPDASDLNQLLAIADSVRVGNAQ